jgi:hypothetical protein
MLTESMLAFEPGEVVPAIGGVVVFWTLDRVAKFLSPAPSGEF